MADVSAGVTNINSYLSFFSTEKGIAILLVVIAVLFNAIFLWAEVGITVYDPNDAVLHLTATQQSSLAIRNGFDPNDYWLTQLEDGYTAFYYYQHLPHVILAELDQVTSYFIPLMFLFDLSRYLLLCFVPVSMFFAMRRFEFGDLSAGISALLVSLISTNTLMGIEYSSYIWAGYGLFTQLWVIFFFPLALAEIYRVMKGDGSWFRAVLLFSIVLLTHLIYGYILLVSTVLFIFIRPNLSEICLRFKRTIGLFCLTGAVTASFFIPLLLNLNYLNRTLFMDPIYYTSYGATTILNWLFAGNLFDYGRLPVITALFFVSLLLILRYKLWVDEKYRVILIFTLFWLIIFFGPFAFTDILYTVLPFSSNILFNRFIGGFQIGAIMIIGAGLPLIWSSIKFSPKLPVIILILILLPAFFGQAQVYMDNTRWKTETQRAFVENGSELLSIQTTLNSLPPGRIYAGIPFDFGNGLEYKIGPVWIYSLLPQLGYDTFGYAYTSFGLSSDTRSLFDNTKIEQYNLFNIRYVLLAKSWTPAGYYTKIKEFDRFVLYEVPTTGYFDLVDAPTVFYGPKDRIFYANSKWLVSSLPLQKQHPINVITLNNTGYSFDQIYSQPEILDNFLTQIPPAGIILNETVSMNEYRTSFTTTRNSYLMLKTSYHPGWEVTIDGQPVSTVMLSPGFVAAPITAGTHQAIFTYKSSPIRYPLFVFGLFTLFVLYFRKQLHTFVYMYLF